jgi:hypothetical protein
MAAYRVYALEDELVVRARLIEARADDEAIVVAADTGWPRWQVWRGCRLIGDSISRAPHDAGQRDTMSLPQS